MAVQAEMILGSICIQYLPGMIPLVCLNVKRHVVLTNQLSTRKQKCAYRCKYSNEVVALTMIKMPCNQQLAEWKLCDVTNLFYGMFYDFTNISKEINIKWKHITATGCLSLKRWKYNIINFILQKLLIADLITMVTRLAH